VPNEIQYVDIKANGLRFNVATCGEGSRLALFLHGFPELAYSWRFQQPAVAALGYRTWAPDLRGYGGSDRPYALPDYAIEALLADVAGLIDAAGADEVVLVGHDWGAMIAWYFAMRQPRRIDRLVIMNVPHPACFAENMSLRQLRRSWYALFFQIPWLPEKLLGLGGARFIGEAFRGSAIDKSRFPDEVLEVYRAAAREPGAIRAMLNYYRGITRGGGARRQQKLGFPIIEVPTLMLWGEVDVALGLELVNGTEKYVRDLTLRTLPNVSHWVQQEAPETVNRMLTSWLRGDDVPYADAPRIGSGEE
jgi:pimeloyl-ACP methyl ester carboxylesterase